MTFRSILPLCLVMTAQILAADNVRPPAVPIVVHDPYFSIWSATDNLTDAETVHWTGRKHPLHAMVRFNDKTYRILGAEPKEVPAMKQTNLTVSATRTTYNFECDEAYVEIQFLTPVLPTDLELMSRPATFITIFAQGKDTERKMSFYFDAGAELAVNDSHQTVKGNELVVPGSKTYRIGSVTQGLLGKTGDNVRIDWGHLILSSIGLIDFPEQWGPSYDTTIGFTHRLQKEFIEKGTLTKATDGFLDCEFKASDVAIGTVATGTAPVAGARLGLILAYDDEYSLKYFNDNLRAWWKRDGKTTETMLAEAIKDFVDINDKKPNNLNAKAYTFDAEMNDSLGAVGGIGYVKLCALSYRHAMGAQKIVADSKGSPLMFSKENFSNGSIGTVDLMYPCSPLLLYYSPALVKATLQPILDYGASPRWKFSFAPHDVGTYPHATGQTYGGGERSEENQMPVEESANMIIQVAALAYLEGNATYAKLHWPILTKWADYLLEKGFDPENQLCTDDFAGHLAHNVNLSAKAIIGIGSYAMLADMLGEKETAKRYRAKAEEFATRWVKEATEGDHTKLAFDKPGTWSMKYNLMWDSILSLKLFPQEVIDKEIAYYKTKMNKFGLPLDNRSLYTKADWILWTATMCRSKDDFHALVAPVIAYVSATESRVPLSDWYFTDTARQRGFQARSVIGGFWAPMLKNLDDWKAHASQGVNVSGPWAPIRDN